MVGNTDVKRHRGLFLQKNVKLKMVISLLKTRKVIVMIRLHSKYDSHSLEIDYDNV